MERSHARVFQSRKSGKTVTKSPLAHGILRSAVFHKCRGVQPLLAVAIASLVQYQIQHSCRHAAAREESEVETLRELLNCIESALKALERSDKKREPRLKTVRVNLQVSRNMVRHFLSSLGAQYPPP